MTESSGFSIWFLNLLSAKKVVLSCPESMVYVAGNVDLSSSTSEEWKDLVKDQLVMCSFEYIFTNYLLH